MENIGMFKNHRLFWHTLFRQFRDNSTAFRHLRDPLQHFGIFDTSIQYFWRSRLPYFYKIKSMHKYQFVAFFSKFVICLMSHVYIICVKVVWLDVHVYRNSSRTHTSRQWRGIMPKKDIRPIHTPPNWYTLLSLANE